MKSIKLILILLLLNFKIFAQVTTIRIKVIDTDSLKPIPFASISNTKGLAYILDDKGAIIVDWKLNDTMIVRALGYHERAIVLSNYNIQNLIRIELKPQSYILPTATVKGISSKEELKRAILKMRVIENPYADIKGTNFYKGPFVTAPPTIMNPISLIYSTKWARKQRSKKWSKTSIRPKIE